MPSNDVGETEVDVDETKPDVSVAGNPDPGQWQRGPVSLTITGAAKVLGVTRQALNNVVNGKAGISPEMAVRLSKAFGGNAEMWVRLQSNYDLAQVRSEDINVKRYPRAS